MLKPIEAFYAKIPEASAFTASPASRPSSTATPSCGSSPGRSATPPAADRRRAAPEVREHPGAIAFPINPPSLGQSVPLAPVEYVIMAQVPYASCSASSTACSTRRASPRRCRTCRPTSSSTRPRCGSTSTATSSRPRRQRRHRRAHAGDDAGRPPGDALQARRRAVRRDRAGRADRPHARRPTSARSTCAPQRRDGAARQPGRREGGGGAAVELNHFNRCARSR
jgi:hypothetical protein